MPFQINFKVLVSIVLVGIVVIFSLMSFDQFFARKWGGTASIHLEKGERLVNVTWKDQNSLWLLTKQDPLSAPQTYAFKESSLLGVIEGKVLIHEK